MRIIHEFYGRAQTTGTGSPYAFGITEPPPEKVGFRMELMAVDCSGEGKTFKSGDALYLEGDGKAIKEMLKSLLAIVEDFEEDCAKKHEKTVAETKQCPSCRFWFPGTHTKANCDYFKKNLKGEKRKKARRTC